MERLGRLNERFYLAGVYHGGITVVSCGGVVVSYLYLYVYIYIPRKEGRRKTKTRKYKYDDDDDHYNELFRPRM